MVPYEDLLSQSNIQAQQGLMYIADLRTQVAEKVIATKASENILAWKICRNANIFWQRRARAIMDMAWEQKLYEKQRKLYH